MSWLNLRPYRLQSLVFQSFLWGSTVVGFSALSAQPIASPDLEAVSCQNAEECFQRSVEGVSTSLSQSDQSLEHQAKLQQVRTTFPDTLWAKRAGLRLALLLMESSPLDSLQYFEPALQDFPILQDYISFWMGKAHLEASNHREAISLFESVIKRKSDSNLRTKVLFYVGEAQYQAGDCNLATQRLQKALRVNPKSPDAPGALLKVGQCALQKEKFGEARDVLREVWWRFPTEPEAKTAELLLQKSKIANQAPTLKERYKRGLSFYNLARFEEAISELKWFLSKVPKESDYYEAQYKLGNAFARLKRYEQASKVFHELSTSQSRRAGVGTVWLARVYLRQNKGSKLLALRDIAHTRHTSGDQQSLIHVFSGVWLEDHSKTDKAIHAFRQASKVARSSQRKLNAIWRVGWIYYQKGDYSKAISTFKEMLAISSDLNDRGRPSYWMARAMEKLNQNTQAQPVYRALAQKLPYTYYGLLAQSHLEQPLSPFVSTKSDPTARVSQASKSSIRLKKDQHYRKALELAELYLFEESSRELNSVIHDYASDQEALNQLLVLAQKAHAHEIGIRTTIRYFGSKLKQGRIPSSSFVWMTAYPTGYFPSIRSHTSKDLDPYLIAGLIREESLYNPRAVSQVGALGLMQLMPATANTVARKLGISSPKREELFNADTNIQIGTSYVSQLLKEYKGNIVLAIAAYNAGPHAVQRWVAGFGHRSPDEFVELISYRETRRYVKRVLGSYRIYHSLANGSCSASSLDRVC